MKVSLILATKNRVEEVDRFVRSLADQGYGDLELIVVDQNEDDRLAAILAQSNLRFPIVHLRSKAGLSHARNVGIRAATGDIILVQDADLEYSPEDYPALLEPLMSDKADAVLGSRFMGGRPHRVLFFWHMVGNKFLTLLSNMFTNLNLTDMQTGYKAFKAPLIESIRIEEDRFGVEPEIVAKLAKLGCRIFEVGISYYGRTYEEGKKIGWRDGFRALHAIIKYGCRPSAY